MFRIRRFGIVQTATTVAVLYMVAITVLIVPIALLVAAAGSSMRSDGASSIAAGGVIVFALIAIVGYGLATWVFTAIACALYNLVAGWVGGIEVQLDPVAPPPAVPSWAATSTLPPAPPAAPPAPSGG